MMSFSHSSKKIPKHVSVANTVSLPQKATIELADHRSEAIAQQKMQDRISEASETMQLHKNISKSQGEVTQLGRKKDDKDKRKKSFKLARKSKKIRKSGYESEDEWVPPSARRKHRQTFSKKLRRQVIMKGALRNKNRLYVCPGCGKPLADAKGKEIKTYYISKTKKRRHNIVSAQLDHYPTWSDRLKKLKAKKKSDDEIRKDHDDPTRLRPLCRECNQSHKFENVKDLPSSGYTDDEYESEDEARDKEIWKKYRKDDDDNSGAGAAGIVT